MSLDLQYKKKSTTQDNIYYLIFLCLYIIQYLNMTETSHNAVILKKSNEARLNTLITNFGKGEPNALRFSEFFQFMFDRCVITNKISISKIYELFLEATHKRLSSTKKEETKDSQSPFSEKVINKEELIWFINELGKIIFHNDKNYQDKIYTEILSEKTVAYKDSMQYPRVMTFDETNKKLLTEMSIRTLSHYEKEMKVLFMIYMNENYWSVKRTQRLLLTQREIDLQNKKMTAVSFVRFLRQAEIVPHLINIQHIEEILFKIVPSVPEENQFYYRHFLSDVYSKQMDKNSETKHNGDPGLLFFEFQMTIARIAWEIYREGQKKSADVIIGNFLENYLHIRNNDSIKTKALPNLNKKYLQKLSQYYEKFYENSSEGSGEEQSEQEENEPRKFISEKYQELLNLPPCDINIGQLLKFLEKDLPELPPNPEIKQQNPPPFKAEKLIIGQQPPPPPVDKNAAKNAQKPKKQQKKKGQPEPRIFLWKQQPKPILKSEDYFQKLASELEYETKPLTSLDRGLIPMEPLPCLITQILYPPEVPEEVLPFIEAGINSHNQSNYFMALENYQKAHAAWKKLINNAELPASIELYFQFTKGSIYSSAGRDDYALFHFYNSRQFTDTNKMQYLNPDRALPYCGIGEVCYNCEQYEMGVRAFLKARQIRQTLIGLEVVDTATVLNNLGCCFFMIDRNKEALSYFKIAHAIFQAELGTFHERTQTASSNIKKSSRGIFENIPAYRKLWEVYEKDPFGKKKKKKKGDKKKKK